MATPDLYTVLHPGRVSSAPPMIWAQVGIFIKHKIENDTFPPFLTSRKTFAIILMIIRCLFALHNAILQSFLFDLVLCCAHPIIVMALSLCVFVSQSTGFSPCCPSLSHPPFPSKVQYTLQRGKNFVARPSVWKSVRTSLKRGNYKVFNLHTLIEDKERVILDLQLMVKVMVTCVPSGDFTDCSGF